MKPPGDVAELCIGADSSLRDAIAQIDRSRRGVVLVVDPQGRLTDLLTDGDVRRLVLADADLDVSVGRLRERRQGSPYAAAVAARVGSDRGTLLSIMRRRGIRHLPLLDERERVVGLVTLEELLARPGLPLEAVIMAGGKGSRLRPLTEDLPKPMLPVGDRPLLEHTIDQLKRAGIGRVHITTHYKPEKITEHFRDGTGFGIEVRYLSETRALGTAGALALLEERDEPLLVINGDILTNVDFRAMLTYHQEHEAALTVATRREQLSVPYGVVDCEGVEVRRLTEKPELRFFVNAGIYLIQPSALRLVPSDSRFDMTGLIDRVLAEGEAVVAFPIHEYWRDIGRPPDYSQAQRDVRSGRLSR